MSRTLVRRLHYRRHLLISLSRIPKGSFENGFRDSLLLTFNATYCPIEIVRGPKPRTVITKEIKFVVNPQPKSLKSGRG